MVGTDPTYKEWKPEQPETLSDTLIAHGSYLQGMETATVKYNRESLERKHGSYLQGMETALR